MLIKFVYVKLLSSAFVTYAILFGIVYLLFGVIYCFFVQLFAFALLISNLSAFKKFQQSFISIFQYKGALFVLLAQISLA